MLTEMEYIRESIEINLFFLRIMKEHIIFTSAALTLRDAGMVPALMRTKDQFEGLLKETLAMSGGILSPMAMTAGDIVTQYTLNAEMTTKQLTGLPIDTNITISEMEMFSMSRTDMNTTTAQSVNSLNQRIITLLKSTIQTQKTLLQNVLSCRMFTSLYPLMIDHVTREAEHYQHHLEMLQQRESMKGQPGMIAQHEEFWNDIMGEHGKFIRGLLDPTEEELIKKANGFADEFEELSKEARRAYQQLEYLAQVTRSSTAATLDIRNFKEQGTKGILECKIRSIILPLLSDHVLREANHYLKTLRMIKI